MNDQKLQELESKVEYSNKIIKDNNTRLKSQ